MRPRTLTEVVERSRDDPDWQHHLREFLDTFYLADDDLEAQAAMIAEDPGFLGIAEADAFLGGVGEHLARRWGLPIPGWVRDDRRYLGHAMFVPDEKCVWDYLLCVSPGSFRARLIFTGSEPLQRARFPYHKGTPTLPMTYPPAKERTEVWRDFTFASCVLVSFCR